MGVGLVGWRAWSRNDAPLRSTNILTTMSGLRTDNCILEMPSRRSEVPLPLQASTKPARDLLILFNHLEIPVSATAESTKPSQRARRSFMIDDTSWPSWTTSFGTAEEAPPASLHARLQRSFAVAGDMARLEFNATRSDRTEGPILHYSIASHYR